MYVHPQITSGRFVQKNNRGEEAMRKIRLDVSNLRVESFEMTETDGRVRGTVRALES
jgi:hypothetical protein